MATLASFPTAQVSLRDDSRSLVLKGAANSAANSIVSSALRESSSLQEAHPNSKLEVKTLRANFKDPGPKDLVEEYTLDRGKE